jgi:hypothetical protein
MPGIPSKNMAILVAGATDRTIACATGGMLILPAFLPKLAAEFVIMPTPIMGASLVFSCARDAVCRISLHHNHEDRGDTGPPACSGGMVPCPVS